MLIDLTTGEFTNLIMSIPIRSGGFGKFTYSNGDQFFERWYWKSDEINKLTIEQKFDLYNSLK